MTDWQIWGASLVAGFLASAAYKAIIPRFDLPQSWSPRIRLLIGGSVFLIFAFLGHIVASNMTRATGRALTVARDTGQVQREQANEIDRYANMM